MCSKKPRTIGWAWAAHGQKTKYVKTAVFHPPLF